MKIRQHKVGEFPRFVPGKKYLDIRSIILKDNY